MSIAQLALLINGKRSLQFAIVVVLSLFISVRAQADVVRVFEEKVGPVPEFVIPLKGGETVLLETKNLSPGIDPVLHLWDVANRVEVAMDDNSGGGKAAKLRKTVTQTGDYLLIVRPRNFLSAGTTDIFKNGVILRRQVQVEGWYVFLLNLQPKEQINVLPSPLGAPAHMTYLISEDGLHIERRQRGAPRSQWETPAGTFGARTMLIGVRADQGGKPMRLYRNDVKLSGADPDGDGLGTGLERQLQTCSVKSDSLGPFLCDGDHVADLRDSDGDGISDGWEVLGRDFDQVYVPLPTWGSNPRHKDLFIEADYRRLNKAENNAPIAHMPPTVARAFAQAYGDNNTTDPLIRLFHATLSGNPDQLPGISTHIDTGVKPEKPEDAGIYGDWGGYEVIDAVANADGIIAGQDPAALWKTHMHASRRGIFRYGPGHATGGAQCGLGLVYCAYNFKDASNAIHEILHSLGLNHAGPDKITKLDANCKPNYPSAVNYAYQGAMLLSDGRDRPPLNNTALSEWKAAPASNTRYISDLQNTFKYLVDPINGHVDWNRDGIFAPAGQTVRAYANNAPGNSCEGTRLNQVEFSTAATSVAIAQLGGRHTLLFSRDPAGVVKMRDSQSDWDCAPTEENCAGSSFGDTQVVPFALSTLAIDAEPVVIDGRDEVSLVVINSDGKLRERKFLLSGSGVLTLSPITLVIPSAVAVAGVPSLAQTRDGRGLYLIYKGADNVLRWRFRNSVSWGVEKTATDSLGLRLIAAPEASPGIASAYLPPIAGRAALYLAFSDTTQTLRLYSLNAQEQWIQSSLPTATPINTLGRPSMAWVPNKKQVDSSGQFYLTFRDGKTAYRMMRTYYDLQSNSIRLGMTSYFDNLWLDGESIDVIASSTTGQPQLWAALTHKRHDDDLILFRPRADGIVDIKQSNFDDWTAIGWGLCEYVVNPDDTVSNPIRCKKKPWVNA